MVKQNPTVNEHYIPQFYLRNFSADNKRIYQLDIISGKQTQDPVLIKSICSEKNLYEFKDEEGKFKSRNLIEDSLSKLERVFSNTIKSIRNRAHSEESYKSACFFSKEEKALLILFIVLQALRLPESIDTVHNQINSMIKEDISENLLHNTAINYCLPVYKKLNIEEDHLINRFLSLFSEMAFIIGKSRNDSIYTSDKPFELLFDENYKLKSVVFPLSSDMVLYLKPEEQVPNSAYNRLVHLTKGEINYFNKSIIRNCNRWIFSKTPLSKKQIEWILRERKKADELFQHRSLHN